jgi:Rab GDP dissociation inhibitor
MADDEMAVYDIIILGTGITECALAAIFATGGHKVLHADRNAWYGGDTAALNATQLFEKFNKGKPPPELGDVYGYDIDLIPKGLMAAGGLSRILDALRPAMNRCGMEPRWGVIDNSLVVRGGKLHLVPGTAKEALDSTLMGFFEKRRAGKFIEWVGNYREAVEAKKGSKGHNCRTLTAADLFKAFGLEPATVTFIGHAVALYSTDAYLAEPAYDLVMRCQLYKKSFEKFGGTPYLYPKHGTGELPEALTRLCAMHGGTYMLDTPVTAVNFGADGEFETVVFTLAGKPTAAAAKIVVGDPSYFPDRVKPVGKVVRAICILDHPIIAPGAKGPLGRHVGLSYQIIIPQVELKRNNDVYVLQLGPNNKVCPDGLFVAIVSTVVENFANPEADLEAGLKIVGAVREKFVQVSDLYEPLDNGVASKCFISKSYDAATHFESVSTDILEMFERVTSAPYDFEPVE